MTTEGKKQVPVVQPVILDTRVLKPFEIGARLDALLCYPTWPHERQQRLADAICAECVAHWIEIDPSLKTALWAAYPKYKASRVSLDSLPRRRKAAFKAGRAFLPLLKNAAIGELPILHGGQQELSIAEIARYLWPAKEHGLEIGYPDRLHDRERHGIRRFFPIAHLAAANQYIAHELSGDQPSAPFDYQDINLHREVVRRAAEYAGYFAEMPKWKNIAAALVPVVWRE